MSRIDQLEQRCQELEHEVQELRLRLMQGDNIGHILAARQSTLDQARHARRRARRGVTDCCEYCESQIAQERLRILPEATLCSSCADEYSRTRRGRYIPPSAHQGSASLQLPDVHNSN